MLSLIIQTLLSGIIIGSIYTLVAIGLNITFGVMRIVNFAHCQYMMLAMYCAFFLWSLLRIDPYTSIIILLPSFFAIGILTYLLVIKRAFTLPPLHQIVVTIGLYMFLEGFASTVFTEKFRSIHLPSIDFSVNLGLGLMDVYVGAAYLVALVASIALTILLYFVLKNTNFGKMVRAISQDIEGALICGVNVGRISTIAFSLSIALVGFAGVLISPFYLINPHVGDIFLLMAFIIIVFGGMGSFKGAMIGGYTIGIIESFSAILLVSALKYVMAFIFFMLVLLVRPTGLYGVTVKR